MQLPATRYQLDMTFGEAWLVVSALAEAANQHPQASRKALMGLHRDLLDQLHGKKPNVHGYKRPPPSHTDPVRF